MFVFNVFYVSKKLISMGCIMVKIVIWDLTSLFNAA